MLFIFALHKLVRLSFVMASALGVNHPAPVPHLLSFFLPLLLTLSPLSAGTLVVPQACIILDVHKMLTDNISFVVHSSDNCYGTDTVPLSPQYFISAFTFTPFGVQQTWPTPGSAVTAAHSSRPKYVPPTNSIAEAVRSTAADARLHTTFSRPLPKQPSWWWHWDELAQPSQVKSPTPLKLKPPWIVSSGHPLPSPASSSGPCSVWTLWRPFSKLRRHVSTMTCVTLPTTAPATEPSIRTLH